MSPSHFRCPEIAELITYLIENESSGIARERSDPAQQFRFERCIEPTNTAERPLDLPTPHSDVSEQTISSVWRDERLRRDDQFTQSRVPHPRPGKNQAPPNRLGLDEPCTIEPGTAGTAGATEGGELR
jgi:hypothetical protein